MSTQERLDWEKMSDGRKCELLKVLSKKEIETAFTIFFATHKFPNPQSKQTVKISLQRVIKNVFPGYGCRIEGDRVSIDELRSNERLNSKGRIIYEE